MKDEITPGNIFIGRENELKQLQDALQNVINFKQAKVVFIQGDFGVGKTALVESFLRNAVLIESPHLIGKGRCAVETERNGLLPFRQVFESIVNKGIKHSTFPQDIKNFIKEVAPAWIDVVTAGIFSASVKTIKYGVKLIGMNGNEFTQENVFLQFSDALTMVSRKNVVIIFIDDLQWADQTSLELLFYLSRTLQNCPILFLYAYRPVEAMEIVVNSENFRKVRTELLRDGALEIVLKEGIDVATYISKRYPHNSFTPDFVTTIQKQTEGYPLFVSQLFSLFQELNIIVSVNLPPNQKLWKISDYSKITPTIPTSIDAVLSERFRLMEEELRQLLIRASVEGENFTAQVVATILELDEYKILDSLEILEQRYRLVQEKGEKIVNSQIFDFYQFVHRFIREHIYKNLSPGKRRLLHRQVGECLEALYIDRTEIAGQLANHFREAKIFDKSVKYALLAAQLEQAMNAWNECEQWCEFGLALLAEIPEKKTEILDLRNQLFLQLAECNYFKSNYSKVIETLSIVINEAEDKPHILAQSHMYLSETYLIMGDFSKALEHSKLMLDIVHSYNDDRDLAKALDQLSWVSFYMADFKAAENQARSALALYEKENDTSGIIFSLRVLGYIYEALGLYDKSKEVRERGLALVDGTTDEINKSWLLYELGELYQTIEDWETAKKYHELHLEKVKRFKEEGYLSYAYDGLGRVEIGLGNYLSGLKFLEQALEIRTRVGEKSWIGVTLCNLSKGNSCVGNSQLAIIEAEEAVKIFETIGDRLFQPLGLFTLAMAYVDAGKNENARLVLHLAREKGNSISSQVWLAKIDEQEGLLDIHEGKIKDGLSKLAAARLVWEKLKNKKNMDKIDQIIGSI
jgi:predicted ATPase